MLDHVNQLPADLQSRAYRAGEEAAWARADALRVVDHLAAQDIVVLGGEIWLPTTPGPTIPTPTVYHWNAGEKRANESWSAFVTRAQQLAKDYIAQFRWDAADGRHQGLNPYFNLTWCHEQEYSSLETKP